MAMFRRSIIAAGLASAGLAGPALAQDRPVRMLVPFPQGGVTDGFARRLAARMQAPLGQPILVENRVGEHGAVAALEVARARPDGQTILFGTASTLGLYPFIAAQPQFDPLTDLAPVSLVGAATLAFAARTGGPDLAGFVAAARARPGALAYGSPGRHTLLHLAMEMLRYEAAPLDVRHRPAADSAAAIAALVAGEVDIVSDSLVALLDAHRAGRIGIVAVTSPRRSPLLPGVPTVAEALGLPGFETVAWMAVMLPVGVPDSMRDRLAYAINSTLAHGPFRAELERSGFEAGALLSPREMLPYMRGRQARWRAVVEASGARLD